MDGIFKPVTALLLSTAILMTGHGLMSVLVPLRAQDAGFSSISIGLIGSASYVGLIAGCFIAPSIIARVGHIRAFAAFAASATVLPSS